MNLPIYASTHDHLADLQDCVGVTPHNTPTTPPILSLMSHSLHIEFTVISYFPLVISIHVDI